MTKSNLINRICEACRVPAGRSEQIVNAIFDSIEQALDRGERVEIRGFGSFEVRDYRGYVGRNPRTGSTVEVKPKRLAFFKVGKELKDRVQQAGMAALTGTEKNAERVDGQPAAVAAKTAPPSTRKPTPAHSTPATLVAQR
jgi:integration host factor subunit beta